MSELKYDSSGIAREMEVASREIAVKLSESRECELSCHSGYVTGFFMSGIHFPRSVVCVSVPGKSRTVTESKLFGLVKKDRTITDSPNILMYIENDGEGMEKVNVGPDLSDDELKEVRTILDPVMGRVGSEYKVVRTGYTGNVRLDRR